MKKVVDYFELGKLFNEKFLETRKLIENGETHLDNLAEGFHEAEGVIFSLPTIEVPTWIPVTERLPEETGKYIVCTAKGSVYCTKFYTKRFGTDSNTHITHWMPLPKPPKDGDSNV